MRRTSRNNHAVQGDFQAQNAGTCALATGFSVVRDVPEIVLIGGNSFLASGCSCTLKAFRQNLLFDDSTVLYANAKLYKCAPLTPDPFSPRFTNILVLYRTGQTCSNGLAGYEASDVCCPLSCGQCGGSGCSERGDGCCTSKVKDSGVKCSESNSAPCNIDSDTVDPVGKNVEVGELSMINVHPAVGRIV